jgi:hypothetical protein
MGGYRSGKSTALARWAAQFEAPLVIGATAAAGGATFWSLAAEIVGRHDRAVRVLSSAEQVDRLGGDTELAEAVCHYQASFLGREELRTHADAAGAYDQWEAVAGGAEGYLPDAECDWASVLVRASLLLRDDAVLAAERARFDAVAVDDFEAASFAANRLLTQLVGFDRAMPVAVAGNVENPVWRHVAGSPSHLGNFARRFEAREVRLAESYEAEGEGHVDLLVAPGGDPWLPNPDPADGPLPVALSSSLAWASVTIHVGCGPVESRFDLDVLRGPDVPGPDERVARRRREDEARWALARSRGQTVVQPPSTAST